MAICRSTPENPKLSELLREAARHKMTPEERFEQRVSFVYGQMMDCNPSITKDQVRRQLLKMQDKI